MNIKHGNYRELTEKERKQYTSNYKYVMLSEYRYENNGKVIRVPRGFLSDGSTSSPDRGYAWVFHDYLYATHKFEDGTPCTQNEADAIMVEIINETEYKTWYGTMYMSMYSAMSSAVFYLNPFYLTTSAWNSSGERGPEFLPLDESDI